MCTKVYYVKHFPVTEKDRKGGREGRKGCMEGEKGARWKGVTCRDQWEDEGEGVGEGGRGEKEGGKGRENDSGCGLSKYTYMKHMHVAYTFIKLIICYDSNSSCMEL